MQTQKQSNWCWSAVAVSVNDFLDPHTPATWTQCTLATALIKQADPTSPASLDCCFDHQGATVCNQPEGLDVALTITGNLLKNGFLSGNYLTFDCLRNWVNEQLPVCARIAWRDGGGHFIALDGCAVSASGEQRVHVQDPLPGAAPCFWDYDALVEHYDQIGLWHDSYLVTK
jgi:hypothetical protein